MERFSSHRVVLPTWSHTWKRSSSLFLSSFCSVAVAGMVAAVGTADARYKLFAVCFAAGAARIGGVFLASSPV